MDYRLNTNIRNSGNISIFTVLKLVTSLRLGLKHLRDHKFKHNFLGTINPFCSRVFDVETTSHFLLFCPNILEERTTLLSKISEINRYISTCTDSQTVDTFLFGALYLNKSITVQFLMQQRHL